MAEYAHLSIPHPEIADAMKAMAEQPVPDNFDMLMFRKIYAETATPAYKKVLEPLLPPGTCPFTHAMTRATGDRY
jgi:hypothetical protein